MNRQSDKGPFYPSLPAAWRHFTTGDEESFKNLFYRFHSEMCQYGTRICLDEELTRDCIQELFLRLWLRRKTLPQVAHVKAYLFRSLRNDLLKKIGNKSREQALCLVQSGGEETQIVFSPEDVITQSETLHIKNETLSSALNNLPPREREVIWLRYYEELDYQEIAEIMEIRYQSVMNYLYQGFQHLRKDPELKKAVEISILFVAFISS